MLENLQTAETFPPAATDCHPMARAREWTIRTKFVLVIGTLVVLFSGFVLFRTWQQSDAHTEELLRRQTELALAFDLAIRDYVGTVVRPFVEKRITKDDFFPEVMSTSFVARSVFDRVRRSFPDCVIKFSSDNPRNPTNRASKAERSVLEYFRENPEAESWSGLIDMDGESYQAIFHPRRTEKSCIRCHGDPADAPRSLIERYGSTNGFHVPPGSIMAMDTVAIPIGKYRASAMSDTLANGLILIVGLGLLLAAIYWTFRILVTHRLATIAAHFREAVETETKGCIQPIACRRRDEIGDLVTSFNALGERLRVAYASMEDQVEARTRELKVLNRNLEAEIVERKQVEEALRTSESRIQGIVQVAPVGIGMVRDRVFSWVSARLVEMTGYTEEELLGKSARMMYLTEEEFERVGRVKYAQIRVSGTGAVDTQFRRKDGSVVDILLRSTAFDPQDLAKGSIFTALDITERKRAEAGLRMAKAETDALNLRLEMARERAEHLAQEASVANRAKSEFLANMSHEIRTPMHAILGFSEILAGEDLSPQHREYIQIIQESGASLLRLIDDILDFSKIEAGKLDLHIERCSLDDLIRPVEALLRPSAERKGLRFEVIRGADLPLEVETDPYRLRQCLVNLVGNAIKFTSAGHVHLRVSRGGPEDRPSVRFDVEDTGVGIPMESQSSLFTPFTQSDGSMTRKFGGTGLGLAITRKIAVLLGIEVSLTSEEGKGSTFTLVVPISGRAGTASTTPGVEAMPRPRTRATDAADTRTPHFSGRVLVAEDVPINQQIIRVLLGKLGIEARIVDDGAKVIETVRSEPFDLILMDIQMPIIDGHEATRRLRASGVTTPIVALTAHALEGDAAKCLASGCDDYLSKPLSRPRLVEVLSRYLRSEGVGASSTVLQTTP